MMRASNLFHFLLCTPLPGQHPQSLASCFHCILVIVIITFGPSCSRFLSLYCIFSFFNVCDLAFLISNYNLRLLPMPFSSLRISAGFGKASKAAI